MIKDSKQYFKLSEVKILSHTILKIRDFRFKIEDIKEYGNETRGDIPNDLTYEVLGINNCTFYFSEESKDKIKIILHELDELITNTIITSEL